MTPIGILKCSPPTLSAIKSYSLQTGIPMRRVVDDMTDDWMRTVGKARLQALTEAVSQIETKSR